MGYTASSSVRLTLRRRWAIVATPGHPEVQAAVEQAIATIVASGKAAGTLTGDTKLARRYLELGARFVAVGIDAVLLAQSTRRLAAEFDIGVDAALSVAGASAY